MSVEELTFRELVFMTLDGLDNPDYPRLSYLSTFLVYFNLVIVLISCGAFVTETLPQVIFTNDPVLKVLEILCSAWFTFDLLSRAIFCPDQKKFFTNAGTLIDIVAIFPFYLELVTGQGLASALVMFRILRLARILKLTKRNIGMEALVETFGKSKDSIFLLFLLLTIVLTVFSSIMFFVETLSLTWNEKTGQWVQDTGELSPFQSVPDTFWWCIVTITTVGYGDAVPSSVGGKIVGGITMCVSMFCVAFPTIILGATFQEAYFRKLQEKRDKKKKMEKEWRNTIAARGRKAERALAKRASLHPASPLSPLPKEENLIHPYAVPEGNEDSTSSNLHFKKPPRWLDTSDIDCGARFVFGRQRRGRTIYKSRKPGHYFYDPLLEFKTGEDGKRVDIQCARKMVSLVLLLDSLDAQSMALRELSSEISDTDTPDTDMPIVRARVVSRMKVSLKVHRNSPLIGTSLITKEFLNPSDSVQLSLVLPQEFSDTRQIFHHISRDLVFDFKMTCDPEAKFDVPLCMYKKASSSAVVVDIYSAVMRVASFSWSPKGGRGSPPPSEGKE